MNAILLALVMIPLAACSVQLTIMDTPLVGMLIGDGQRLGLHTDTEKCLALSAEMVILICLLQVFSFVWYRKRELSPRTILSQALVLFCVLLLFVVLMVY
jgi:sensor c-di-GMP phosphodiesterase-like protein